MRGPEHERPGTIEESAGTFAGSGLRREDARVRTTVADVASFGVVTAGEAYLLAQDAAKCAPRGVACFTRGEMQQARGAELKTDTL